MEFIFKQCTPKFFLYQPFTLGGMLPVREANLLDYIINIGNYPFNNDMGVLAFSLVNSSVRAKRKSF
jgi:hypothetical protein